MLLITKYNSLIMTLNEVFKKKQKGRHTDGQQEKVLSVTNIGEMQRKTAVRYHLTPVRMVVIKMTKDQCWIGEEETVYTAGGM